MKSNEVNGTELSEKDRNIYVMYVYIIMLAFAIVSSVSTIIFDLI